MVRAVLSAMFLSLVLPAFVSAQDKTDDLVKAIDLGPLEENFKLVAAEHVFDPQKGGTLFMKLRAKKDIDISSLYFRVGFFDKDNYLHLASPLRYPAAFPIRKGEAISLEASDGKVPQEWHRIVVRKVDRLTRSE